MNSLLVKLWQALVSGLSIGSIYALIAEGYYITFITTGTLNFGQGEFLMVGALFGLTCYVSFGLPYAVAVFAAVLLTGRNGHRARTRRHPPRDAPCALPLVGAQHGRGQHHSQECGSAALGPGAGQVSVPIR